MPKNIVVGLDIGSTKVAAIVGEVSDDGEVRIVGVGECPSKGLRKGIIVDIERTAKAVEQAAVIAERMSGCSINSVYVGITGPHIKSVNNRGVVAVANAEREITVEDVQRVLQAAKVIPLPADRRIIHVLPRQYIVDGYDGIIDPVGMAGSRLEVETQIVTGAFASIQNSFKAIEKTGLEVEDFVLNPLASGEAVLLPAEKELAAVVVDIGGGTTEIALFDQGGLWFTSILPVGGDYVTSDLAVGLRTPLAQAEQVKKEHGCVLASLMPDDDYIEISSVGGQDSKRVSKKMIASIIEPRMHEIFTMVRQEIINSGYGGLIPGGVILTGGSSAMDGVVELATEVLQMPVRLGFPTNVGGLSDIFQSPGYATGIGLVLYGSKNLSLQQAAAAGDKWLSNLVFRIKSWFQDLF